jgi:N-dimethylarginine dimethylaminohydrolase
MRLVDVTSKIHKTFAKTFVCMGTKMSLSLKQRTQIAGVGFEVIAVVLMKIFLSSGI